MVPLRPPSVRLSERPVEGIRLCVVPVAVLVCVRQRQHGPTLGIPRGLLDGPFQTGPYFGKVLGGEPLVVAEAAQQSFVWAHLIGSLQPHHFAHTARQNSVHVGDGGDDPWYELVLQFEHCFGAKDAFIVLSPKMSARNCVYQLHRES
jgi:hypothetical protein